MIQIRLVLKLCLLMGVGTLLRYRKVVTEEGKRLLTDLILNVVLPCNILYSFLNSERVQGTGEPLRIFLLSLCIQAGSYALGCVLYRFCEKEHLTVLRYATICSNSGILGTPVATELLGAAAGLFAALYLLPLRVAMWTVGLSLFTEKKERGAYQKMLLHPCIIATLSGLVLMLLKWSLPALIEESLSLIAGCNTFLCLLLVGCAIADMNAKELLHRDAIYFTAVRLVILPLLVFVVCRALHIDGMVRNVAVLLTAMPAGATTSVLALRYDKAPGFAAACTSLSTIASFIAIPVWTSILL